MDSYLFPWIFMQKCQSDFELDLPIPFLQTSIKPFIEVKNSFIFFFAIVMQLASHLYSLSDSTYPICLQTEWGTLKKQHWFKCEC